MRALVSHVMHVLFVTNYSTAFDFIFSSSCLYFLCVFVIHLSIFFALRLPILLLN